jgi:hypothetical protein
LVHAVFCSCHHHHPLGIGHGIDHKKENLLNHWKRKRWQFYFVIGGSNVCGELEPSAEV